MAKHLLRGPGRAVVCMRQAGYIESCVECRRLDLQARSSVLELTLLEAARRLNRTDPVECDRFNVLIEQAREEQKQSQIDLWTHVREHSSRETRALVSQYVN